MPTRTTSMSFSDLMRSSTVISDNIKLNAEKIGRFGLDLPAFTAEVDNVIVQADALSKEQERLRSLLASKTDELDAVKEKLNKNYALAKKTVKLAEPQVNWMAYGIDDKK